MMNAKIKGSKITVNKINSMTVTKNKKNVTVKIRVGDNEVNQANSVIFLWSTIDDKENSNIFSSIPF